MIYSSQVEAEEKDFLLLLGKTRKSLLKKFVTNSGSSVNPSPLDFESDVCSEMCELAVNTIFEGTIKLTGAHAFPDIVAKKYFGVEVKMTAGNKWVSTGNSVMESTRVKDVKRIFLFFGKFGNTVDFKFRLYQECLHDIAVTHSPRYKINMDLKEGSSIFDRMGCEYEHLRNDKQILKVIKEYYRNQLKEGEELWWIDSDSETSTSPIIRPFRNLTSEERTNLVIEAFILFPEIFGNTPYKFERVAAYFMTNYNVICSNLRDVFTAGGKEHIRVKGQVYIVPQIYFKLWSWSKSIKLKLASFEKEKLLFYWRVKDVDDRELLWKKLVDFHSLKDIGIKASSIFDS